MILVRHLPTSFNRKGLLQGKIDNSILPIFESERKEIEKNLKFINKHFSNPIILVSKYKRTQETASVYGFESYTIDERLNELDFGDYEGKEKSLLISEKPDWLTNPLNLRLGEELKSFNSRIIDFLSSRNKDEEIVIFGHGAFIRAAISITNFGSLSNMNQIEIKNNELVVL